MSIEMLLTQVDRLSEDATVQASSGEFGEEAVDDFEPQAEVGVKWKVKRG